MATLKEISNDRLVIPFIDLKRDIQLIKQIQRRLHKFGLYDFHPDDPDGSWGPRTETGLEQFCDAVHLNSFDTGQFGPTFAEALLDTTSIGPIIPDRFGIPTWWQGGNKNALAAAVAAEGRNQGVTNRDQWCYIMATIQHETAHTYRPIAEFGGKRRPYAPYYGRGYVQLTHKFNYKEYSDILNENFITDPDKVMQPAISLFIIVHGMKNGTFTKKRLDDFISGSHIDFLHARKIVNGMDRAGLIEGYAKIWQGTTAF